MPQVRCPVLIGRTDEVREIEDTLAETRAGSGGVVFVLGEAGIGKSRLLREISGRASAFGMTVLAGRAVPGGERIPLRPLVEAVQSWTRAHGVPDESGLTPYRAALGELIPEWRVEDRSSVSPVIMMEALVRLLRVAGERDGVVLTLDDLQWADADTLSIVEYLADNLVSEPVCCVCALRSDEPGPAGRAADALVTRRGATPIVLDRLGDADVDEMMRASLPGIEWTEGIGTVRVRAEGVPFLVEEMLSAYLTPGSASLPRTFQELIRSRMGEIDAQARGVVQAAAALGRASDWNVVAAITGLSRDAVLDALRAATSAHLVRSDSPGTSARFEFRHALIREAILADLLPPERTDLYAGAADALEAAFPGLPGELCQLAADLRDRAGDRTGATQLLLEIARRALSTAALETAEATLRRALELAEEDRWRTMGIDRMLVQVLGLSGKAADLREIGEDVLAFHRDKSFLGGPLQFSDLHLHIARGLAGEEDAEEIQRHLDRSRWWADRGEHREQLVRIDAFQALILVRAGELERAEHLAARAGRTGVGLGLEDVACEALRTQGILAFLRGDTQRSVQILEQAVTVAERADLTIERARIHLELARVARSTSLAGTDAARAHELSRQIGAVAIAVESDIEVARLAVERFDLALAAEAADHAVSVSRRYGLGLLQWATVTRAQVLALLGDGRGVAESLKEARAGGEALPVGEGEARAVLHLLREERSRALAALDEAVEHAGDGPAAMAWPFHGMRILVKVLEGASVADAGASLATPAPSAHAAGAGFLAAAEAIDSGRRGDAGQAALRIVEALALLGPFVWRRAVALRLVAEAGVADGWGEPAAWAEEALTFFAPAGLERAAAACRGLLQRSGVRVRRKGRGDSPVPGALAALGITAREVDVLRLVGEGLSNAEIAKRLFISVRTVETHASRLLQKAGLESRAQLVAFAGRLGEHTEVP